MLLGPLPLRFESCLCSNNVIFVCVLLFLLPYRITLMPGILCPNICSLKIWCCEHVLKKYARSSIGAPHLQVGSSVRYHW